MMMPDRGGSRGQSRTEHWYSPQPSDRSNIGQQKIDQLQRQIHNMQDDMQEQQRLIQKLDRLQQIEKDRKGLQDKVIDRNSPVSRLLHDEIERLYGRDSVHDTSRTPVDRNVIETVIQHRTKEFSAKQQEAALQAKYLDKERERLREARQRIQEQRRLLLSSISPTGKINFIGNYPNTGLIPGGAVPTIANNNGRGYPNFGFSQYRGVPNVQAFNSYNRSYPNVGYDYGGGAPNMLRNTSYSNELESVNPDGYSLVNGDTYLCDTDLEKKFEVTYQPKPLHVREMKTLDEYDVYVTKVPVYSKRTAKGHYDNGVYKKRFLKFKDIDKIKGIETKPHLSTDLYSSENGNPYYTDIIHYKLPDNMNYSWAPVMHSVFDSLENRVKNSDVLPIIVPKERPKTRVKVKFVPVDIDDPLWRYKPLDKTWRDVKDKTMDF